MNERPRPSRVGAKLHTLEPCSLSCARERVGFEEHRAGRARRVMDLHDPSHNIPQGPQPVLTPAASLFHRLSPRALRRQMFLISLSELLGTTAKPSELATGQA